MASITIRNLDDTLKSRLRIQAATHGRSMEDEARDILRSALSREPARHGTLAASSGVSAEMAIRLDKALGGGADPWHLMQANYEMAQAIKLADKIKVQRVPQPILEAE